jgi:fumarate reductase subunit C
LQSSVDAPRAAGVWPARLDVAQSLSGLCLAAFLVLHMAFVSSILISERAFYTVARFFEGRYLLGASHPGIVSGVVAVVLLLFVAHAALAMRKLPHDVREFGAFRRHAARFRHPDTRLWAWQAATGFALFFLATIHLYGMLTHPALIGPYESADRVWTGRMWPLYLVLLFVVELHGGIGLYRLALKWDWPGGVDRGRLRTLRTAFSVFFITLGLLSLGAYVRIGVTHADRAGERWAPAVVTSAR